MTPDSTSAPTPPGAFPARGDDSSPRLVPGLGADPHAPRPVPSTRRPDFSGLDAARIEPGLDALLERCRATLERVVERARDDAAAGRPPSWDSLVQPRADAHNELGLYWSPISHLHSVADAPALREAYKRCLPKITAYWTELGQNRALYEATAALCDGPAFATLDAARRREVLDDLRDFELGGVALEGAARTRFGEIAARLSELSNGFSEHVLDATNAWSERVSDVRSLEGLPASDIAAAAARASAHDAAGTGDGARDDGSAAAGGGAGWLLNLEYPTYHAVMTFAHDRELRRRMHVAFVTRASDRGPQANRFDNGALMHEILALRAERAALLGFPTPAHLSMARKMVDGPDEVVAFLNDLAARAVPVARAELDELARFAAERLGLAELEPWDIAFASERLKRERHAIGDEDLKPYFPAPHVVAGLFAVLERLFGLRVERVEGASVWHPDVTLHRVLDADGALRGEFYLDLYARPGKRGGAWMDVCATRQRLGTSASAEAGTGAPAPAAADAGPGTVQVPAAYLTCSLTPPVGEAPALLTHTEVTTLFHEFGHGLHHVLTRVDAPGVSGIGGVEWDAVELPSQFLENWCWERESLDLLASHHETGEPLPDELLQRLIGARRFQSAMALVRQLELGSFDMHMHLDSTWNAGTGRADVADVQATLDAVRARAGVVPVAADNRFQHAFTHVFAGGYAAGYFSYKWAEVLSADAFARFEEEGLFARAAADDFLHEVLEVGGSRPAMESYVAFRGRPPTIDALLAQSGLVAA